MTRFEEKYNGVDLKLIDPHAITDPEECHWLMGHLDQVAAHITAQIEFSMIADPGTGDYPRDLSWRVRANRALRGTRVLRQAVQNHLGLLNRSKRQQDHLQGKLSFEATFVDVAKESLPQATFELLCAKVKMRLGKL